ncbi:MAG: alpha/beta fold hydrolase [Alphaproteobacteria bacterium]|nr:alpha/beta fold hydrolase [Alphaproteobacteria bacterium]
MASTASRVAMFAAGLALLWSGQGRRRFGVRTSCTRRAAGPIGGRILKTKSLYSHAFAIVAAALCIGASVDGAYAKLPAEVYAALPEITQARISPDGQYVAMLQPVAGAASVTIYKMGGGAPCAFAPTDVDVLGIVWASSRRVLVRVSYVKTLTALGEHRPRVLRKLILINTECKDPKLVLGNLDQVRESLGNTDFVGRPPNDPEHILIASAGFSLLSDSSPGEGQATALEIYKVDPETGHGDMVYRGSAHITAMNSQSNQTWTGTNYIVLDANGEPRIRYDQVNAAGDVAIYARLAGSEKWEEIYRYAAAENEKKAIIFQGFSTSDPNIAYAIAHNGNDRATAYEFDLKTKRLGRVVYQDPNVDVGGYYLEPYTRRILGVEYEAMDGQRVRWIDRDWAQIDADLHATFENSEVYIASATVDRKKFTVYVDGPQDPGGTYYYYDSTKPEIFKIGALRPRLTVAETARKQIITYKSRDGKDIAAYLTIPPGASAKNMPMVVMPHGGPEARDYSGFDWWAQFVASRGFIVLQPQFRGSDGFGEAWKDAGRYKWGLEMQNDVSDGVKYLIDQGMADPKRVCIVGWSYGGYAALAGVTLTPELYKCGVAVAGVSNLITMLGYEAIHYGMGFSADTNYWPRVIGDPTRDAERLRATSPALHADRVTASLLLIHGQNDTTVPIEQSEQMAQAMDKAGKPYQFVRVTSDDHQMRKAISRKQMLEAMDKFLQEQLK